MARTNASDRRAYATMQGNAPIHSSAADAPPDADASQDSDSDDQPIDHRIVASPASPSHALRRQPTVSKSYTTTEERAVTSHLDRNLVRFLALLYLLSFLDRSNIGNARVAGLEAALQLTSDQFDLCLVAFYITYITFEWMIMLYKFVPPHVYISCCVACWGVVASLQSSVTGLSQLVVLRALLGITEASFGPGVPYYMTFFYKREELAYRVGLQISAAPLATAFASGVAWVILKLNKGTGLEDWRALFLYEGAPSIVVAWFAWYWIPDSPSTARWLSPRLRKVAVLRLQNETTSSTSPSTIALKLSKHQDTKSPHPSSTHHNTFLHDITTTLSDPKSWLTALMFLSVNVSFSSLPVFLPTIISSMSSLSSTPLTTHLLTSPPYLLAFLSVLVISTHSDRTRDSRGSTLGLTAGLSCASYTVIALVGVFHTSIGEGASNILRYVAVYPAATGLFSSVVLIITWTLNNQASATARGAGMVVLNVVGQCGPLIGVRLFPERDGPLYVKGMAVCAGFMGGVVVLSLGLRWWLGALNRRNGGVGGGAGGEEGRGYEMVSSGGAEGEEQGFDGENGQVFEGDVKRDARFVYML